MAPNFSPLVTGRASWSVRSSLVNCTCMRPRRPHLRRARGWCTAARFGVHNPEGRTGSLLKTDGQRIALPFAGWKVTGPFGRLVNRVPPPCTRGTHCNWEALSRGHRGSSSSGHPCNQEATHSGHRDSSGGDDPARGITAQEAQYLLDVAHVAKEREDAHALQLVGVAVDVVVVPLVEGAAWVVG